MSPYIYAATALVRVALYSALPPPSSSSTSSHKGQKATASSSLSPSSLLLHPLATLPLHLLRLPSSAASPHLAQILALELRRLGWAEVRRGVVRQIAAGNGGTRKKGRKGTGGRDKEHRGGDEHRSSSVSNESRRTKIDAGRDGRVRTRRSRGEEAPPPAVAAAAALGVTATTSAEYLHPADRPQNHAPFDDHRGRHPHPTLPYNHERYPSAPNPTSHHPTYPHSPRHQHQHQHQHQQPLPYCSPQNQPPPPPPPPPPPLLTLSPAPPTRADTFLQRASDLEAGLAPPPEYSEIDDAPSSHPGLSPPQEGYVPVRYFASTDNLHLIGGRGEKEEEGDSEWDSDGEEDDGNEWRPVR